MAVKFKDADLLGIPWQVVIGKKGLKEGVVEVTSRKTKEKERLAPSKVMEFIKSV